MIATLSNIIASVGVIDNINSQQTCDWICMKNAILRAKNNGYVDNNCLRDLMLALIDVVPENEGGDGFKSYISVTKENTQHLLEKNEQIKKKLTENEQPIEMVCPITCVDLTKDSAFYALPCGHGPFAEDVVMKEIICPLCREAIMYTKPTLNEQEELPAFITRWKESAREAEKDNVRPVNISQDLTCQCEECKYVPMLSAALFEHVAQDKVRFTQRVDKYKQISSRCSFRSISPTLDLLDEEQLYLLGVIDDLDIEDFLDDFDPRYWV